MGKEKKGCIAEFMTSGGWRMQSCSRTGKIERNGKFYCGIHDPMKVKARRDAAQKKWDDKWKVQEAKLERVKAMSEYFEGVSTKEIKKMVAKKGEE